MVWQQSKAWADEYLPQVASEIGRILIRPSSLYEDVHEASDLKTLTIRRPDGQDGSVKFAWRTLSERQLLGWPHDITFRTRRPRTGNKTEWAKILIDGFGDYFFFNFGLQNKRIGPWAFVNLHAMREEYRSTDFAGMRVRDCKNVDGSSDFKAFDASTMSDAMLVATSADYWTKRSGCACQWCKRGLRGPGAISGQPKGFDSDAARCP